MKVAILGAGPSAAYIARACLDMGIRPDVYSDRQVQPAGGAFWLYWLPESVEKYAKPHQIFVSSVGTPEVYCQKMWGEILPTSFPKVPKVHYPCYDPKEALGYLWGDLTVKELRITSDSQIEMLAGEYDLVFQTFPSFRSFQVLGEYRKPLWIWNLQNQYMVGESDPKAQHVLYDGFHYGGEGPGRLRLSNLFGWTSIEYSRALTPQELANKPDGGRMVRGWKLHPSTPKWEAAPADNVVLIGRFAQWERKLLSHDSYTAARKHLESFSLKHGSASLTSTSA